MSLWLDLLGCQVHYLGRRFRTRVIEAGEGTPLILLHGLGGHAEAFSRNVARLGSHYRTMAMDLVWHGLSSKPPFKGQTLEIYEAQVLDLLDSLGLESAHVLGTSLGGWIGLWLALHHPTRLRKLVVTVPAGIQFKTASDPRIPQAMRERALNLVKTPTRENNRKRLEQFMVSPDRVTEELVETRFRFYSDPATQRSLANVFDNSFGFGASAEFQLTEAHLQKIRTPTLVVWTGADTGSGAKVGKWIADCIPNGEFVCIDDSAHWPQWEKPGEHNRVLLSFLGKD